MSFGTSVPNMDGQHRWPSNKTCKNVTAMLYHLQLLRSASARHAISKSITAKIAYSESSMEALVFGSLHAINLCVSQSADVLLFELFGCSQEPLN